MREEINFLARRKGSSKEKVIEIMTTFLEREKEKVEKKKRKQVDNEDDSVDDDSIHCMDIVPTKKTKVTFSDGPTEEEKEYVRKLQKQSEAAEEVIDVETE